MATRPSMQGAITDAGATVGKITLGGTFWLFFLGANVGISGGLLYVAVKRWVPGSGLWKGLTFGLLLLLISGSAIIEGDNPDFFLFGPPFLNISTFASLFILFGLLVVPLTERLDRSFPAPSFKIVNLGSYVVLMILGTFLGAFGYIVGINFPGHFALVIAPYLLAVAAIGHVLNVGSMTERLDKRWGRRNVTVVGYAVLAIPCILGLVLNAQAIGDIFKATR